ncbi:Stem-specific protein TSJT1 [Platanthera zijinensis]|uniref:Stem-specific protein TSJT1 n=1 Tax=Platanthera zijinensis TaxID=2320716 RepID=A0AAP0BKJ3_9ASPA
MLAVFNKSVAKAPEGLKSPASGGEERGVGGIPALLQHFSDGKAGAVSINLGSSGALAYCSEKKNPFVPRIFAVVDNMFCLFEGLLENIGHLKQQYGLTKTANEPILIIEAYRTLRDRGPYPAPQVVGDLHGKFAFILFDSTTKSTFIASNADGGVPFFWGTDAEDHLVLSDDVEIVKKACGKSFAPFPKGCFFTSAKGLESFEHPLNVLKPVPRVDSQGEVCGATFKVDSDTKKKSVPRVGSAADWSSY